LSTEVRDADVDKLKLKTLLTQNIQLELKTGSLELGDTAIFDFEGF
jgi:FKBP-type peptidyl-prolyl cis-trans isomerase (trigger factor)